MFLQSTRFSEDLLEGLPPPRKLLTHISSWPVATGVLSRSKGENPGNEVASMKAPFVWYSQVSFNKLFEECWSWYALRTLFQANFREYLSIDLLLVCKDKLKSNWSSGLKDWRTLQPIVISPFSDRIQKFENKTDVRIELREKSHVPLTFHDNKETGNECMFDLSIYRAGLKG